MMEDVFVLNGIKTHLGGIGRNDRESGRSVRVGWLVDSDQPSFIFDAPRSITRKAPEDQSQKGVNHCPALIDYESRLFEIACPIDLHLRLRSDENDGIQLTVPESRKSPIIPQKLSKMALLLDKDRWR